MMKYILIGIIVTGIVVHALHAGCNRLPPLGVSPLFTFGHSVLPQHNLAFEPSVILYEQNRGSAVIFTLAGYYGFTDRLSLTVQMPFYSQKLPQLTEMYKRQAGLGDVLTQVEYSLHVRKNQQYRYRINGLCGLRIPTSLVDIPTFFTFGTPSVMLGVVQDAMTFNWYAYSDVGYVLETKKHGRKFGDFFLYNTGAGRIICWRETYLTILAELSGVYTRPDRVNGIVDLTTGGYFLLCGPTARLRLGNWLIQYGWQYVVGRNLRYDTEHLNYRMAFAVAYDMQW